MNRGTGLLPGATLLWLLVAPSALAATVDLRGLLVAGGTADGLRSDEFTESLAKSPSGIEAPAARLALRADAALGGDFVGALVATADSQRSSVADVEEAWLGWQPVPQSPWRLRAKAGAYFPVTSLELAYDQVDWRASRTISSAVINSWIAEEIRILGAEFTLQWRGALIGSPRGFTARLGAFGGNDPAGTMLAWRGWHPAGRVTGLMQRLRLPDLPVYRPDGPIAAQTRNVHVIREIDDRPGYYAALAYSHDGVGDIEVMHYDNRGDPLSVVDGQYSWHTRFDHLGLTLSAGAWTLLSQALRGSTLMGPDAVHVDFASWYLLASRQLGPGRFTLRHDRFNARDRDIFPDDPNGEDGRAWALAYALPLPHALSLVTEVQRLRSHRAARELLGQSPRRIEDGFTFELRWSF